MLWLPKGVDVLYSGVGRDKHDRLIFSCLWINISFNL